MVGQEALLEPRSEAWAWGGDPVLLCAIAGRQPWIDRISDRFFERSFQAAFRRSVEAFRARERLGARAFGSAALGGSVDASQRTVLLPRFGPCSQTEGAPSAMNGVPRNRWFPEAARIRYCATALRRD